MDTGPIFADPSGRRHRLLWFAGAGAAGVLVIFLGAVAVAVSGGPRAPFTQWVAPRSAASVTGGQGAPHGVGQTAAASVPGIVGGLGGTAVASRATASPAAGAALTASPSPSPSAGRTAPGQTATSGTTTAPGQTKSPNPHKPSSVA